MDCITGDMLGAMVEITEAGLFLIISLEAISKPLWN
jgi:cobalamin synthase